MQGSAEAELAYARLEALCAAVKTELQQDLHIHDAAVLPNFVNLPKVAAAEYGRVSTTGPATSFLVNKERHICFAVISNGTFSALLSRRSADLILTMASLVTWTVTLYPSGIWSIHQ